MVHASAERAWTRTRPGRERAAGSAGSTTVRGPGYALGAAVPDFFGQDPSLSILGGSADGDDREQQSPGSRARDGRRDRHDRTDPAVGVPQLRARVGATLVGPER